MNADEKKKEPVARPPLPTNLPKPDPKLVATIKKSVDNGQVESRDKPSSK
jgi:hypothetical protein